MNFKVYAYENRVPRSEIAIWDAVDIGMKKWNCKQSVFPTTKEELEKLGSEFASDFVGELSLGSCSMKINVLSHEHRIYVMAGKVVCQEGKYVIIPEYLGIAIA